MSRLKIWTFILLVTSAAAFTGYKVYSAHVAASMPAAPPTSAAREDLQKFMQARVHQEYTFLSFTIWHDRPLTPAKMDSIVASSGKVMEMAKELNKFEATYKQQGWNDDDLQFFDDKRLQLSRVAEELNHAAQKRDSTAVVNFFMHLDSTCQSCHKRFRPELQWI
jgi:cytochrome c556